MVVGAIFGRRRRGSFRRPIFAARSANERKPNSLNSLDERLVIEAADAAGVPIGGDRHVRIQADELARQQRLLAALRRVSCLSRRALRRRVPEIVERAVGFEQLLGGFRSDAGDAGDVVDFVADEGLEIDDLIGPTPQSSRSAAASKTWFLRMLKTATRSVMSCRQSLSPVTMKQFAPASSQMRASVASTSSAS